MARARKRGISEETVIAYNPLPDVDEGTLLIEAGLEDIDPGSKHPFALFWQYSAGQERETIELNPGEELVMRESDARDFQRELGEQGLAVRPMDADEDEINRISDAALRRAHEFWRNRGGTRIVEYRKTHGISKEELDERKYDIWSYHLNQARADAIKKLIGPARRSTKKSAAAA